MILRHLTVPQGSAECTRLSVHATKNHDRPYDPEEGPIVRNHAQRGSVQRPTGSFIGPRGEGISPARVAPTMGHSSSAMVEKVYGKLSGSDVAAQIGEVISLRDAARRRKAKGNRASG